MPFIDIREVPTIEPVPGCRMRTPFGEHLMLSYLEMDEGAEVPWHSHPHEQGGILIRGRVQLSIGDETRICEAGSMFIIPPNVKHRAVAGDAAVDAGRVLSVGQQVGAGDDEHRAGVAPGLLRVGGALGVLERELHAVGEAVGEALVDRPAGSVQHVGRGDAGVGDPVRVGERRQLRQVGRIGDRGRRIRWPHGDAA